MTPVGVVAKRIQQIKETCQYKHLVETRVYYPITWGILISYFNPLCNLYVDRDPYNTWFIPNWLMVDVDPFLGIPTNQCSRMSQGFGARLGCVPLLGGDS